MPLRERVYSVLVVSGNSHFADELFAHLPDQTYLPVDKLYSINSAQRRLAERTYDFVIINTPLPDDFGIKFAIDVSTCKNTVVTLFVKSEMYATTYDKVCDYGVMTIPKPTNTQTVIMAFDLLKAMRERIRQMESKTLTLQEKMEEIKIVNRAKWALITYCKMTEADAHRYIEKQSMDRCLPKRQIAENILQTYKE